MLATIRDNTRHVYLQNKIKPQHILDEDYTIIIISEASGRNI